MPVDPGIPASQSMAGALVGAAIAVLTLAALGACWWATFRRERRARRAARQARNWKGEAS